MKRISGLLFLLLYAVALCKPLAPFLEYEANREYFIEVLCTNKSRPELECNGQCALVKKLQNSFADESQPINAPAPSVKLDDYPIGFISITKFNPALIYSLTQEFDSDLVRAISAGFTTNLLRPPCFA